jgi:TetR/AcrR family fatty acid metabolism transcriptional regulator
MRAGAARRATRPGGRKRTWTQDPEGRRARILETAARIFARRGFRATRVDEIAREAGVAEGTVYHLFASKARLLAAVGDAYGKGFAEAAFGAVNADLHPADVGVIVRNIYRYVRETDGPLAAFLLTNDPHEGGPARDANRARMLAAIEALLRRWIGEGLVPPLDPRIAAEIHYGLVESSLRDCFLRGGDAKQEIYIREVTRCLAAGLGQETR